MTTREIAETICSRELTVLGPYKQLAEDYIQLENLIEERERKAFYSGFVNGNIDQDAPDWAETRDEAYREFKANK